MVKQHMLGTMIALLEQHIEACKNRPKIKKILELLRDRLIVLQKRYNFLFHCY
jgi:hypothetical protein